jgi:hypothetical protein
MSRWERGEREYEALMGAPPAEALGEVRWRSPDLYESVAAGAFGGPRPSWPGRSASWRPLAILAAAGGAERQLARHAAAAAAPRHRRVRAGGPVRARRGLRRLPPRTQRRSRWWTRWSRAPGCRGRRGCGGPAPERFVSLALLATTDSRSPPSRAAPAPPRRTGSALGRAVADALVHVLGARLDGGYEELPGTPHMQTLERPELVADALGRFLPTA